MPQIKIEYTNNLKLKPDLKDFYVNLHQIIHNFGKSNIENCKSRLIEVENYFIGSGNLNESNGFIHLSLEFLEGRSDELKSILGEKILNFLQESFLVNLESNRTQITVHISDIKRKSYFKLPKGSFTNL